MERRRFIEVGAALGTLAVASRVRGEAPVPPASRPRDAAARALDTPTTRARGVAPVVTPNGSTLPLRDVDGVKVGHLVAAPVEHEFAPGLVAECWGYNGSTPGPTIEAFEGDRLRLYVTNQLPEGTTVHWHGVWLPAGMDGVAGLTQPPIAPGETYVYEFPLVKPGTFMYHPHFDEMTQIALGMMGMFVVHPRRPRGPTVDHDFALVTHEWRIDAGARRPNPLEMSDFNVLTFNSKAFPGTAPLVVRRGDRVRLRFGNLSPMDHHPIHLHGYAFELVETDGGFVPKSARHPDTTVLVPVGSTRVVEFVADAPGDWAMHCHMTHHMMNQMGHGVPVTVGASTAALDARVQALVPGYMSMGQHGSGGMGEMDMPVPPNSIPMRGGRGPFGLIDMGGMFTLLKVREPGELADEWYRHPEGTLARPATASELARDGVDVTTVRT